MTESTTETLYCYVHPNRETALRCNNCNRPICAACAIHTPTGYRCRECVKGQQKAFNTSEWYDYILGFIVAMLLSAVAAFLVTFVGGIGFFGWFLIAAGAAHRRRVDRGRGTDRDRKTSVTDVVHYCCRRVLSWARCQLFCFNSYSPAISLVFFFR